MSRTFLFFLVTIFLSACTAKMGWIPLEFEKLGKKMDEGFMILIPEDKMKGVPCTPYGHECVSAREAKVKMVKFIAVEMKSEEAAKKEAARIDGYFARNWLFDDVSDEPVLEQFVRKAFAAKRPRTDDPNNWRNY